MAGYDPLYFSQTKARVQAESVAWGDHCDAGDGPLPGAGATAEPRPINTQEDVLAREKRDNVGMDIEQLEKLAAVTVTAVLVAGNFLLFTPWRKGEDPRQRQPESLIRHTHQPRLHQGSKRKRSQIFTFKASKTPSDEERHPNK